MAITVIVLELAYVPNGDIATVAMSYPRALQSFAANLTTIKSERIVFLAMHSASHVLEQVPVRFAVPPF